MTLNQGVLISLHLTDFGILLDSAIVLVVSHIHFVMKAAQGSFSGALRCFVFLRIIQCGMRLAQ